MTVVLFPLFLETRRLIQAVTGKDIFMSFIDGIYNATPVTESAYRRSDTGASATNYAKTNTFQNIIDF